MLSGKRRWFWPLLVLMGILAGCGAPAPTEPPAAAPTAELPLARPFTLTTPEGAEIALADYAGQVVMVNFWASWCPPCAAEMPELEAYYQTHQHEGFVIIGVNVKDPSVVVADFAARHALTFPLALDLTGRVSVEYGVVGLPSSYFINREGRIIGYWPGALDQALLEEAITPLLQAP